MRSRVLRNIERSKVLVTTKAGPAFLGILYDFDSKVLTLRNVKAIAANEDRSDAPVDGEVLILFEDVAYMQRP